MARQLPPNLPDIAKAKLPATYESARMALKECSRIDECATWAKKAEALASYAKQAEDDSLRKMADRIQARAIQRCGELLQAIPPARGGDRGNAATGGRSPIGTRARAARDAGMSADQRKTALRVASIPREAFEQAVESDDPPTVTELAERGTVKRPLVDLKGRDPEEFARSTEGQGMLQRAEEFMTRVKPAVVVRGASTKERHRMQTRLTTITPWLRELHRVLKRGA